MSSYYFVVAKRRSSDQAQLTGDRYGIDSTSLMTMIETYHTAIGEEEPYFHWLEDGIEVRTFEDAVDIEACTKPDVCLKTLKAFREGVAAHADVLPPFTWIVERSEGRAAPRSSAARVRFEDADWNLSGGWEQTIAREVGKGKKARKIDLRKSTSWACHNKAGDPIVLEFERHPFGAFIQRDVDEIIAICERARALKGLVAIAYVS